jgi:hypothetical protein
VSTATYDVHGVVVAVAAAHEGLLDAVGGRLRHFACDASAQRADISFDLRVDGAALRRPSGPGRPVYDPPSGEVSWFGDDDCLWIDDADGVRVRCEPRAGRSRLAATPARAGDLWMLSRPMITLPLLELLKRRGLYGLHAGGVACGGDGVLLAGASGAGKSTLTMALLRGGFDLLGDDMVFLRRGPRGDVVAHGFPDEVDLTPRSASFFAELDAAAAGPPPAGWPKHRVRAEELYGSAVVRTCAPRVLLFPAVSGEPETRVEPMDPDAALLEIAPNVLLTDARTAQAHLDALGDLVRQARCLRMATGTDLDRVPDLVRGLLAG